MTPLAAAASGLTLDTLLKLAVGGLAAGVGVTITFSTVIYCADRVIELRRNGRPTAALLTTALGTLAGCVFIGLVVSGVVLVASKS